MEIFAFKVGVGPKGPQQYLLGLSWASDNDKQTFEMYKTIEIPGCPNYKTSFNNDTLSQCPAQLKLK